MAQGADIPHERFLFGGPKGVLPVAKISQMHGKMTVWCQSELDTIIIKFLEPHILLQAFFKHSAASLLLNMKKSSSNMIG